MKRNLLSIEAAIQNAALKEKESVVKTVETKTNNVIGGKDFVRVTQKEGSQAITLKRFPKSWHDILKENNVFNMSEYILQAVKMQMKRDNLL